MDRVQIIKVLIREKFDDNASSFARAIGVSPAQVYQWLSGHRLIGDAAARRIEMKVEGLWQGYMDGRKNPFPDVKEIRLNQLERLITSRFGGSQTDFARAVERAPAVVWQYMSGHRSIGEGFARHVEKHLNLEPGWMDGMSPRADREGASDIDMSVYTASQIKLYDAVVSSLGDLDDELARAITILIKRSAKF